MHHRRHIAIYLPLVTTGAIFAGVAGASFKETPLFAALLLAHAAVVAAVFWMIRDSQRRRGDVAAIRNDVIQLRAELTKIDEHTELVASRTERLARVLEIQKAVRPTGLDPEDTGEILTFPAGPRRIY